MNPDACRTLRDIEREERQFRREVDEYLAENDLKAVPLEYIVIDPESREDAERFALGYIGEHAYSSTPWDQRASESRDKIVRAVQAGFRAVAHPPKPAEPKGLGAVVEDTKGRKWIRVLWSNPWTLADPHAGGGEHVCWPDVAAVKVLSEGVTP